MKPGILALAISILAISAAAQNARKVVVWSGDPACGFKNRNFTPEDQLSCASVATDRGPVSTITHNGVTLSAAFLDDGEFSIVAAHIANKTAEVVGFDSDLWGAAHYRTRDDFIARAQPLVAETSMPSRDIIRSMAAGTRLNNSLGEFMSDISMTAETRELKKLDGTKYKVTVIVPDKEAKVSEARQGVTRVASLTAEQQRIRSTALTAKYVPAGGSIRGLVYFRRVKKAEFVVFSMRIADTVFVFQLPRARKD